MRKLLFLILVAAAAYWGYVRYLSNPLIFGSLDFPAVVAFRVVSHIMPTAQNKGYDQITVVAVNGRKWREESGGNTSRRTCVSVFDGDRFVCSFPQFTVERADPTKGYRQIFAGLPQARYEGIELLNGHNATVWIDRDTHFLARMSGTGPDDTTLEEDYKLLPIDLENEAVRLFDTRNSMSLFGSYFNPQ
jgi:hypothetical protein